MNAHLNIIRPGPHCTLQDLGRIGFQKYGFTQSGAADEHAFRWANALLANHQNTACLEITLGMFSATFLGETQICVCGANSKILINDIERAPWRVLNIHAGDTLNILCAKAGFKLYLAVKHGFIAPRYLDSYSMNAREKIGLNKGQAFTAHQTIEYTVFSKHDINTIRTIDQQYIPDYSNALELSVIPSPEFKFFSNQEPHNLFNNEYIIQADSSKMGYKLSGQAIDYRGPILKSSGVSFGTIQIPKNGQPIILLKDHQTIGGYPKIGTISQIDGFKLSQKRPGEKVSFKLSTREQEEERLRTFLTFFNTFAATSN